MKVRVIYTAVLPCLLETELSHITGFVLDEETAHSKRNHKLQLIFSQRE